jgi:multisubunit Na+/H+ antiporter MnhE subunit
MGKKTSVLRVAEFAAWWAAGMIVWVATLSATDLAELVLAAIVSMLVAGPAMLGRRAIGGSGRPRLRWLSWVGFVMVGAVLDCVRLVGWLFRGTDEADRSRALVTISVPSGDESSAIGWRQGAMLSISATPGTLVVDSDPGAGTLLLHPLSSGWPDLADRVSR